MKKLSKVLVLVLSTIMVLAMSASVFAQTVEVGGGTGSITITNAAQGKTYSIYKLFDAKVSGSGENAKISYTVPTGKELPADNTWFAVDAAGNVSAKEGADITSDAFKTWAKEFGTQVGETVTAADNTVKFDKIPFGYYFVESSLGGLLTVDSTAPDAEVIDKNPTEPVIPDEFKTAGDTTAQLGDDVDFTVQFTATNYVTKNKETTQVTEYVVEDNPTALAIDKNSIKVEINNADKTADQYVDIDVTNGKMTITLQWAKDANEDGVRETIYPAESDVKITYTAKVTKVGADAAGIKNAATVKYNDTEKTTEVEIDTYKMTVNKVDGKTNEPLTDAQFELYRRGEGSALTPVNLVKISDTEYRVATDEDETTVDHIVAGTGVVIKGLDGADTYELKETVAPEGYNVLTENEVVPMNNADQTVTVKNNAGTELPSTGGIGTTIFYILGSLLVVGCGIVLVSRKRMQNNK